jgi:hypothetical protein
LPLAVLGLAMTSSPEHHQWVDVNRRNVISKSLYDFHQIYIMVFSYISYSFSRIIIGCKRHSDFLMSGIMTLTGGNSSTS